MADAQALLASALPDEAMLVFQLCRALASGNPAKRFRTLLTHLWIQLPSFCPRKSVFGKRKICNFEGLFASFREKFAGCVAPNQMAKKMSHLHFREFFNTLRTVGERALQQAVLHRLMPLRRAQFYENRDHRLSRRFDEGPRDMIPAALARSASLRMRQFSRMLPNASVRPLCVGFWLCASFAYRKRV